MQEDITTAAEQQEKPEHPAVRMRRLARELSQLMAEQEDPSLAAIIFPEGSYEYPVMFLESRQYGAIMMAVFAYEKAYVAQMERYEAFKASGGPSRGLLAEAIAADKVGYFDAKHKCNLAHLALIDCFEAAATIDGKAVKS